MKIKMDALQELIKMEKTTSKMVEDQMLLMGEVPLATVSDKWSKNYIAVHFWILVELAFDLFDVQCAKLYNFYSICPRQ